MSDILSNIKFLQFQLISFPNIVVASNKDNEASSTLVHTAVQSQDSVKPMVISTRLRVKSVIPLAQSSTSQVEFRDHFNYNVGKIATEPLTLPAEGQNYLSSNIEQGVSHSAQSSKLGIISHENISSNHNTDPILCTQIYHNAHLHDPNDDSQNTGIRK